VSFPKSISESNRSDMLWRCPLYDYQVYFLAIIASAAHSFFLPLTSATHPSILISVSAKCSRSTVSRSVRESSLLPKIPFRLYRPKGFRAGKFRSTPLPRMVDPKMTPPLRKSGFRFDEGHLLALERSGQSVRRSLREVRRSAAAHPPRDALACSGAGVWLLPQGCSGSGPSG
jgi:hypothetical protein